MFFLFGPRPKVYFGFWPLCGWVWHLWFKMFASFLAMCIRSRLHHLCSLPTKHNMMLAVRLLWSWEAAPSLDLTIIESTDLIWQHRLEQPSLSGESLEEILLASALILNAAKVRFWRCRLYFLKKKKKKLFTSITTRLLQTWRYYSTRFTLESAATECHFVCFPPFFVWNCS